MQVLPNLFVQTRAGMSEQARWRQLLGPNSAEDWNQ